MVNLAPPMTVGYLGALNRGLIRRFVDRLGASIRAQINGSTNRPIDESVDVAIASLLLRSGRPPIRCVVRRAVRRFIRSPNNCENLPILLFIAHTGFIALPILSLCARYLFLPLRTILEIITQLPFYHAPYRRRYWFYHFRFTAPAPLSYFPFYHFAILWKLPGPLPSVCAVLGPPTHLPFYHIMAATCFTVLLFCHFIAPAHLPFNIFTRYRIYRFCAFPFPPLPVPPF